MLNDGPTNPDDPEETSQPEQQIETDSPAEDSSDTPPDLKTSGSTPEQHKDPSVSEKLKARIDQTENPVLRSKLLKIQSMHDEINLLSDPQHLTKDYLAIDPADLVHDNTPVSEDDDVYCSPETEDDGNFSLAKWPRTHTHTHTHTHIHKKHTHTEL